MSDETIQYITTDYLIEVDGGEPTPAPIEYIVELGQVGVQGIPGEKGEPGFSPTVGYILNDNTFKINITNQDGVTQTPNLYDYFADKNGYLKVDGSNANNPISINGLKIKKLRESEPVYLSSNTTGGVCITNNTNTYLTLATNELSYRNGTNDVVFELFGQYTAGTSQLASNKDFYFNNWNNSKFYYGYHGNYNEIATVDQIPTVSDATITLTQGGVTKGTFTLNGSATTIDLDAGGGSITNPLTLTSTDGTRSLTLGINNSNNKIQSTYNFISGGSTFSSSIYLLAGKTDPITLTDDNYGKYTIGLKYDDDTIKVNQDGELYAVGGGGGGAVDSVNGQTGTVVLTASDVGALSDTTVIPTNSDYVDLTTDQTVGGTKTFSNDQKFGGNIYLDGSSNAQGVVHKVGNTRKHLVLRNNQASTVYVGNTSDALNLRGSGTRPSYYANSTSKDIAFTDDIPSVMIGATSSTAGTAGLVPAPTIGDEGKVLLGDGSWSSDYVTRTTNQVGTDAYITGNKQFAGTVYLSAGKVIIQNNNNTQNIGLINNTSDLQISTYSNKNIKFTPNGTGKLYYGNNEIATINDIPSISNLADNNLSNVTFTGQTIAVTWGMPKLATTSISADFEITPSNITFNNGIFVGYYTPNVNGYLFTSAVHSGTGGVYLRTGKANDNDTIKGIITFSAALGSGWGTNAWIPLRKGVPAQIWANSLAAQTDIHCFFAPCVGGY